VRYLRKIIDDSIRDIHKLFSDHNFIQLRKEQFPKKTLIEAWRGSINCAGHKTEIIVEIAPSFPDELPKIYLTKDFKFFPIPHVDDNRFVCTFNSDAINIFSEKPKDIVAESIEKARSIISDGILGKNKEDFENEFIAYWSDGESNNKIYSIITIHDTITKIKIATIKVDKINGMIAGDSEEEIRTYIQNLKPSSSIELQDGLFIPLGQPPMPPFPTSNRDIFLLLQNRDQNLEKAVKDFLIGHNYKGVIVFSVNIDNQSVLAAWYHIPPSKKSLTNLTKGFRPNKVVKDIVVSRLSSKKIVRCSVERLDAERLQKRIGQDFNEIRNKKICIIGCGSIGSNLAMQLVKSGIEELILVDNEMLLPENVYRHVCGMSEVNQPKSIALSKRIASQFPHIKIEPYNDTFH